MRNIRITPSNRGRSAGFAAEIESAQGQLGLQTEQASIDQQAPEGTFGTSASDLVDAGNVGRSVQSVAQGIAQVATSVRNFEDGRDKEQQSKDTLDIELFSQKLKQASKLDVESSASEKSDVYNSKMEQYISSLTTSSKYSHRGARRAKSSFKLTNKKYKLNYLKNDFEKNQLSDAISLQQAKFETLRNTAVLIAESGDANSVIQLGELLNKAEETGNGVVFQSVYGNKAEAIKRAMVAGIFETWLKSAPPQVVEQALANDDFKTVLVEGIGEADAQLLLEDMEDVQIKHHEKNEREFEESSKDNYHQVNNDLLLGKSVSIGEIQGREDITLAHKNQLINSIKTSRKRESIARATSKEVELNAFSSIKKHGDNFLHHFPQFHSMPLDDQKLALNQYQSRFGAAITTQIRERLSNQIDLTNGTPENVIKNAKLLTYYGYSGKDETTNLMLSKIEASGFNAETVGQAQAEVKDLIRNKNSKGVIDFIRPTDILDLESDLESMLGEEAFISNSIKSEYANLYSRNLSALGNEKQARNATVRSMRSRYKVESIGGLNKVVKNGIMFEAAKLGMDKDDVEDLIYDQVPQLREEGFLTNNKMLKNVKKFTPIAFSKFSNGKIKYRFLDESGSAVLDDDGNFIQFGLSEPDLNKLHIKKPIKNRRTRRRLKKKNNNE